MYKRVDTEGDTVMLEGFSYENIDGEIEYVKTSVNKGIVFIHNDFNEEFGVYTEDIPKLIKALEAAYNHLKP